MERFSKYDLEIMAIKIQLARDCKKQIEYFKNAEGDPLNDELCRKIIEQLEGRYRDLTKNHEYYISAIDTLSDPVRRVFQYKYIGGFRVGQIAREMRCRPDVIRAALKTGENQLIESGYMYRQNEKRK